MGVSVVGGRGESWMRGVGSMGVSVVGGRGESWTRGWEA